MANDLKEALPAVFPLSAVSTCPAETGKKSG
jgi:hypothetical protein